MREAGRSFWDSHWPWLAYLAFYPLPWIWTRPGSTDLIAAGVAITLFLPAYLLGHYSARWRLPSAVAVLAIGIALAVGDFVANWTVFAIYAAAMIALLRPPRLALTAVAAVAAATLAVGLLLGQPMLWWLPGVLLVLMTGLSVVSREAFYDRALALAATQEEVRRLAGTAERERITRDLHDVVGRTLTLVALKADLAVRLADTNADAAQAEMRTVASVARSGLAEVRAALFGQAGGSLSNEIESSIVALEAAGIQANVRHDEAMEAGDAAAVLAMTLREAVTNVIRHAGAACCTIVVARDGPMTQLTVDDDGRGGAFLEGNGIRGMRQRIVAAGGRLHVTNRSTGTHLMAQVPA